MAARAALIKAPPKLLDLGLMDTFQYTARLKPLKLATPATLNTVTSLRLMHVVASTLLAKNLAVLHDVLPDTTPS